MAITNVVNANGTTPLPVGQGGTSTTSLTTFALLKGDAAGHVSSLTAGTNGQLPIGSTGSDPVMATLTQGSGITITNGAGSITIAASGGGGGGITDLEADDTNTATGTTVTIAGDGVNIFTTADNAATLTVSQGPALALPQTNAGLTEGVITIDGSVFLNAFNSGGPNIFLGFGSGNTTLLSSNNYAIGSGCLTALVGGGANIALGTGALAANTDGATNIAVGIGCMASNDQGSGNVAMGTNAATTLNTNTANNNTAIGNSSLSSVGTGSDNIALGNNAGAGLTTTDSSNICIGNIGVSGDVNTIRIGTQGSSAGEQDSCFIAGIAGVTVSNSATVLIDTTSGEMGTIVSSLRFKHKVLDMGEESSAVMKLRPVTFAYKQDATNAMQYGLIAEEAAEVMPHLVTYDAFGHPYTIRYHDLPSILLNELQKLSKRVAELEAKLADKE